MAGTADTRVTAREKWWTPGVRGRMHTMTMASDAEQRAIWEGGAQGAPSPNPGRGKFLQSVGSE